MRICDDDIYRGFRVNDDDKGEKELEVCIILSMYKSRGIFVVKQFAKRKTMQSFIKVY